MRPGFATQRLTEGALALIAAFTLLPFVIMVSTAAKDPAQIYARFWSWPRPIRWDNFAFGIQVVARYVLNSAVVSGAVCALTVVIAALAAYAFSVLEFHGRKTLYMAVVALMMVPGILMLVPLFITVRDLGLVNTYAGLILPQTAGALTLAVFLFRNFFDEVPRDLFDTARIDGAREWQVLLHVVMPLSMPIVSTVAVVTILGSWNNYIWPLLVVRDEALRTLPLGLAFVDAEQYLRLKPGKLMAEYTMGSVPMVVCFLFAMRTFIRGMTSGAIKG